MASPFFQSLIDKYGEREAERIYKGVTAEYQIHVEKHVVAIESEGKQPSMRVVVDRVKADPDLSVITAMQTEAERR